MSQSDMPLVTLLKSGWMICCVWTVSTSPELSLAAHCLRLVTCILTQMVYSDKIHCFQAKDAFSDWLVVASQAMTWLPQCTIFWLKTTLLELNFYHCLVRLVACVTRTLPMHFIAETILRMDWMQGNLGLWMRSVKDMSTMQSFLLIVRAVDCKSFSQHVA